jgi:MscS family membrane protein
MVRPCGSRSCRSVSYCNSEQHPLIGLWMWHERLIRSSPKCHSLLQIEVIPVTRTTERQRVERSRVFMFVSISCLLCVLSAPGASGKESKLDSNPLRPADTSSPRDTLSNFLSDTSRVIEDFRQNKASDSAYRALYRAMQTLDFSTTPQGDSWFVRSRRVALLQELLARIELPPLNTIPGDAQVADGTITQWTIPDTGITIAKIAHGPHTGQFLFSADTVEGLDRLYRQAKHLPYRSGATIGVYEDMVSRGPVHVQEQQLRDRLKPVDTSSPRSTFESFLSNVNRAYELVSEANSALRATPPTITKKEAREMEVEAGNFLRRASDTLDLSQVSEPLRPSVSILATLELKEVFDRMLLPPVDALPTADMVEAARKEAGKSSARAAGPFYWKLPNTQIEIVEILEGERKGQFLFSTSTVRRIGQIYRNIKDLPYRQARFGGTELEYLSPGLSPGFYDSYVSASGYLVPRAHFLGRLVDLLPSWFKERYAGQMVWQWIGLALCVLLTVLVVYAVYRYISLLAKQIKSPLEDWLRVLAAVIVLSLVIAVSVFIDHGLKFTSKLQAVVTTGIAAIVFVLWAWVAFVSCKALAETIVATPRMRYRSSESALLRIGAWVVGFLLAAWIVISGIRSLGADLIPLLAGLGIGGLAVALAAQSTIANFIGGLILLANKPVQVGDFCRYGEDPSSDWLRIGTVEEINWMSTRIRGIDRTVTTIPNAEFSNMHIVNLTKRDQRLVHTRLQLRYETTSEQMRYILVRLRELLLGHPKVTPDPARVRFVGYDAYSKDVEIFCYLRCREQNEFLAIQEDLLLRIEDIIKEAGSGFAFPSQTAYLTRDTGLDETHREEAETRVGQLRVTGKLPFPEFGEEEREQLEDVLDYPPKGSPDYTSRVDGSNSKPKK